jgi:hypothetical protein
LQYEELDTAIVNEIVKNRIADTFERVMKSYRVSGRDVGVMVELQKINGAIDSFMTELADIKPTVILGKVQTSK